MIDLNAGKDEVKYTDNLYQLNDKSKYYQR